MLEVRFPGGRMNPVSRKLIKRADEHIQDSVVHYFEFGLVFIVGLIEVIVKAGYKLVEKTSKKLWRTAALVGREA
jgi:hypothetical protein